MPDRVNEVDEELPYCFCEPDFVLGGIWQQHSLCILSYTLKTRKMVPKNPSESGKNDEISD